MSANHAKDFDRREAGARETARWLRPNLHRAMDQGLPEMSVSTKDMNEILAYMEAAEHKERVEFSGRRLGFADPDMIRDLLSRKRASVPALFKKTARHCVEVFYLELPPKPEKNPVAPSE